MRDFQRGLAAMVIGGVLVGCAYIGRDRSPDPATPAVSPSSVASPTVTPSREPTISATPDADEGHVSKEEAIDLLHKCGVLGRVAAYFRVPHGRNIWDYFPEMGKAPEIEGASGLFVAVYDDPVSGLFLGRPGVPREPPTDVLCVITPPPELEPNIYANVSRDGMVLPQGAYVPAPDEWLLPTTPVS